MTTFTKAVKHDAKLRLALCGTAGSGKTYSSLAITTALLAGTGKRIAYVDTEHGSASKYADLFSFDVIEPDTFDPRQLTGFIHDAVAAGYGAIIVDSLSHYWMGTGGELDLVDNAAKQAGARSGREGNSFAAWKTVTPFHNQLVDTIIGAPIHVIACMRKKTEWVIEKDDRGKSVPRKIGMDNVMRDGIEFEFDVAGDLDQDNNLTVTKSRCPDLSGKVVNRPGDQFAGVLRKWLSGAPVPPPKPESEPKASVPASRPQTKLLQEEAQRQAQTTVEKSPRVAAAEKQFQNMLDAIGPPAFFKVLGNRGFESLSDLLVDNPNEDRWNLVKAVFVEMNGIRERAFDAQCKGAAVVAPAAEKAKQPATKVEATPTHRFKSYTSMMGAFKVAKEAVGDRAYYEVLKRHGFEHANAIVAEGETARTATASMNLANEVYLELLELETIQQREEAMCAVPAGATETGVDDNDIPF